MLSLKLRKKIASCPNIGAGNFLFCIKDLIADKDKLFIFSDIPILNHFSDNPVKLEGLSLNLLEYICKLLASWYVGKGIKSKDNVAIYMSGSMDYFFHYLALTSLGAVPVWLNGKLNTDIAYQLIQQVKAVGIITDEIYYQELSLKIQEDSSEKNRFLQINSEINASKLELPKSYPYKHNPTDPVIICHTSGTTGLPKLTLYEHKKMFYAISQFLVNPPEFISEPPYEGQHKIFSILPSAHHSCLTYFIRAILSGVDLMVISRPQLPTLFDLIKDFRPSIVISFPYFYSEMANLDLGCYDLNPISFWLNTGDAAHQAHIKKLIKYGHYYKDGAFYSGSQFLDGLASSEMASMLFRIIHTPDSNHPLRCVGFPMEWVDAAVLSDAGEKLPPFTIGKLGVKSPTITNYWGANNSNSNYFFTGDMAYQDEYGQYYQVDRITDIIKTKNGVLYSTLVEEIILYNFSDISECTVIGITISSQSVYQLPKAFLVCNDLLMIDLEKKLYDINVVLASYHQPHLEEIALVSAAQLPIGITGKILKRKLREMCLMT